MARKSSSRLWTIQNGRHRPLRYDGTRDDYAYVALRLDLFQGEYYPFSDLQKRFDEYDIVADEVGIDTTSENGLPRLILQVATSETGIDEDVLTDG